MGLVLHKLADALRDLFRDVPVKKMLVAALGETLFYVVTQASTAEAPPHWAVPPIVYQMLQRCMRPDEDVGVLVHAVRTVENIATVAGPHCASLARNDIVLMLWALIAHAKQAALRRACVAAVFHLSCIDPALLQHLVDKAGVPALADLLRDTSPRARQAALSLLLLPFSEQSSLPRAETALMESEELVAQVIRSVWQGEEGVVLDVVFDHRMLQWVVKPTPCIFTYAISFLLFSFAFAFAFPNHFPEHFPPPFRVPLWHTTLVL